MAGETCLSPAFFLGEAKLYSIFFLEEKNQPLGEVKLSLVNIILYLEEIGPPFGNIGVSGEICLSLAFFLGEVKLHAIFSLKEKNLPLREVILSSCRNLILLRGTTLSLDPPLENLLSAIFLGTITFPTTLSFRGVNLPLREKALFLEGHSLNLPTSFSLGVVNLPHGEMVLSTTFSLRGTNSSSGEFVLPFGENFVSLENQLCHSIPCCIPIKFLFNGGSIQIAAHSFFNLSTRTRQYLGTHTFLGESFPVFLDSLNALRSKPSVLTKAIGRKGSSSISISFFFVRELEYPFVDHVLYDISETPTCISSMVP